MVRCPAVGSGELVLVMLVRPPGRGRMPHIVPHPAPQHAHFIGDTVGAKQRRLAIYILDRSGANIGQSEGTAQVAHPCEAAAVGRISAMLVRGLRDRDRRKHCHHAVPWVPLGGRLGGSSDEARSPKSGVCSAASNITGFADVRPYPDFRRPIPAKVRTTPLPDLGPRAHFPPPPPL